MRAIPQEQMFATLVVAVRRRLARYLAIIVIRTMITVVVLLIAALALAMPVACRAIVLATQAMRTVTLMGRASVLPLELTAALAALVVRLRLALPLVMCAVPMTMAVVV